MGRRICLFVYYVELIGVELRMAMEGATLKEGLYHWMKEGMIRWGF